MIVAFVGAVVVWVTYRPHWDATDDAATKLAVFATGPEIRSTGSNLVTEIVGTGVLVFGVLAIAANAGEMTAGAVDLSSVFATGLNPLLVGLLVWSIGLSLGGPTGYASTPLATSDRGSPMRCCRSPARAAPTGAMVGYRWPDRWSAVCSRALSVLGRSEGVGLPPAPALWSTQTDERRHEIRPTMAGWRPEHRRGC